MFNYLEDKSVRYWQLVSFFLFFSLVCFFTLINWKEETKSQLPQKETPLKKKEREFFYITIRTRLIY